MANEYLQRTPTSSGNRKVFTWSGWIKTTKESKVGNGNDIFFCASSNNAGTYHRTRIGKFVQGENDFGFNHYDGVNDNYASNADFRDFSSWSHYFCSVDTTKEVETDRVKLYVNGVLISDLQTVTAIDKNLETFVNGLTVHYIGADGWETTPSTIAKLGIIDVFMVDGQALTPDVFGFYKDGNGYISAGTTQATDFRPGQWVPHTPRRIKSEINRRGGFGVNGFYLPMNSSNNFGADFHCEPDTILKLKSSAPQPKAEIDGVGDYTGALRDDPLKDYLVLAIPGVSGGLQNGFGDYSAAIRGSGTPKTITNSNATISTVPSYYGSAMFFNSNNTSVDNLLTVSDPTFDFGTNDFTVEFWGYSFLLDTGNNNYVIETQGGTRFAIVRAGDSSPATGAYILVVGSDVYTITGTNYGINQWHHLAVCRKNGVVTAYLNGVASYTNTISTNITAQSNSYIGGVPGNTHIYEYQGYLQDLRVYKGVAKYKGGFDVPKPYTPVGIATWRAVPDTTANNFATLNPLHGSTPGTYTNGNLTIGNPGTNNIMEHHSTIGMTQGKWYCEARVDEYSGSNHWHFGVSSRNLLRDASNQNGSNAGDLTVTSITDPIYRVRYEDHNAISYDGGSPSDQLVNGDIVGVAVSITTPVASAGAATTNFGTVQFYRNGSTYGNELPLYRHQLPLTGAGGTTPYTREWFFAAHSRYGSYTSVNFGQNPTFSGNTTAGTYTDSNGKGLFKYQPPSGFLALCEDNLPTPAISDPGEHFKTVLYAGDGSNGRSISGVGFQPDFIWFKGRNAAVAHVLNDTVRGVTEHLNSDSTGAASIPSYPYLNSVNNDGFSLLGGSSSGGNIDGRDMVAWCWKAGEGNTVTNTDGSITSQVSVNQDAGFSIASWTGNGISGATLGHGIGKIPKFIIVQTRQGTNNRDKPVYHVSTGTNYATVLNSTSAGYTSSAFWNNTAPSSTVVTLGNDQNTNQNTSTYIAYCWAEVEGFSKFGSYVGNESTDGPFIYCGFKPAFVLVKSSTSVSNWLIMDNARNSTNPVDLDLYANLTNIETQYARFDYVSNGFKVRNTSGEMNTSGETYIFAAFAESPFSTANAK